MDSEAHTPRRQDQVITGCPRVKTLFGTHTGSRARLLVPIRCKCWTCGFCRHINLKQLLDRIRRGRPTKLLTLTCHPQPGEQPEDLYARHRPAIRKLLEKIRDQHGPIEACIICELHVSGNPHWHLVARGPFIPQTWLSRTWLELTGSRVVDIRRIKNDRHAACYVAKYVGKTVGRNKPTWLKRVVQFTHHYAPKRRIFLPTDFTWKLRGGSPEETLRIERIDPALVIIIPIGTLIIDPDAPIPDSLDPMLTALLQAKPP